MSKKIDYAGIPDEVLDMVVGECYGLGEYTLRYELDKWGDDIIAQRHNVKVSPHTNQKYIEWFQAWTEKNAYMLVDTPFGDRVVIGLSRNPPEELNERNKKNKRTKRNKARTRKK